MKENRWITLDNTLINLDRITQIILMDTLTDMYIGFKTANSMYIEGNHFMNTLEVEARDKQNLKQLIDELNVQLEKFGIPTLNYQEELDVQ